MVDDERRREEKKGLELSRQTEDIQKQRDKAVDDHLTEVAVSHDLSMEKDRLKRELERVLRDHQREKEAEERDFDQRVYQEKLHYEKELQSERSKAADIKKTLDKQVEELKVEIAMNQNEMEQKEKDHLYKMERKDKELATMEESLARAQMRKNEIGELTSFSIFISINKISLLFREETSKY